MSDSVGEGAKVVGMPTNVWTFGPFRFEISSARLYRGHAEVHLTPRLSGVLRCLVERRGEAVSKDELFSEVWNGVSVSDDALLQVVSTLRKALGDDPRRPAYIQTLIGEGYRFIAQVQDELAMPGTPAPRALGEPAPADFPTSGSERWGATGPEEVAAPFPAVLAAGASDAETRGPAGGATTGGMSRR